LRARERERALEGTGLALESLKRLLRREDAARRSATTQALYARAEAPGSESDWLEVTAALQEEVLREGGVSPAQMAPALWLLRSAAQLWPEDEELRTISCWVRHNRAAAGTLRVGMPAPDLPLYPIVGLDAGSASGSAPSPPSAPSSSVRRVCAGKPTLLVAGSFS